MEYIRLKNFAPRSFPPVPSPPTSSSDLYHLPFRPLPSPQKAIPSSHSFKDSGYSRFSYASPNGTTQYPQIPTPKYSSFNAGSKNPSYSHQNPSSSHPPLPPLPTVPRITNTSLAPNSHLASYAHSPLSSTQRNSNRNSPPGSSHYNNNNNHNNNNNNNNNGSYQQYNNTNHSSNHSQQQHYNSPSSNPNYNHSNTNHHNCSPPNIRHSFSPSNSNQNYSSNPNPTYAPLNTHQNYPPPNTNPNYSPPTRHQNYSPPNQNPHNNSTSSNSHQTNYSPPTFHQPYSPLAPQNSNSQNYSSHPQNSNNQHYSPFASKSPNSPQNYSPPNSHQSVYSPHGPKQPPDGTGYREPPMLNDKLFPRDNPWPDEMGGMGVKGPHIQVRGLVYETRGKSGGSHLLDGISLEARGGEVLAVLATNECEGSCLLDVLANRHSKWGGRLRGDFLLNGNLTKPAKVAARSTYVQQDVNFCPDMSVRQTLLLHSFFRASGDVTRVRGVKARINGLINDLGLEQVRHTRVKDLTLSERRRLNVACHLLLETDVVLLDQPTRGMDIFDTFFLIEYLRQWACRGRIVILTIQPPTYEIFTMISRVALISTGRLMYFGRRREMLPYFAFIEYPCPAYKNPSDYYLDLVTLDDLSAEAMLESSQRVEMLAETFRRRQEALSDPGAPGPMPPKVRKENLCLQLLGLWIRAMIYQFPYNMMHWLAMTLVAGVMSVVVGAVYWDVRSAVSQHQEAVNNRAAFHYVMASVAFWPVLLMSISEVWRDKPAVARDVADGLYSKGIYIITKICYSFLAAGGTFLAYILPAYTMAGFPTADQFYFYLGYMLLYLYAVRAIAIAAACVFDSRHAAAMTSGFIMTVAALGAGFTLHPMDITVWSWPTLWWSPVRWLLHEVERLEFQHTNEFLCDRNPVLQDSLSAIQRKAPCGVVTGAQALRYLGLNEPSLPDFFYPAVFILAAYLCGQIVTVIAFVASKKPNRTKKYKLE